MGAHIGYSESPALSGDYIEPRAVELLVARGWTPPDTEPEMVRSRMPQ